ncbi:MAG: transketolase [Gemmatimonadota bacterium]|nr:transketolase [Gemmatimonadota bacterium]
MSKDATPARATVDASGEDRLDKMTAEEISIHTIRTLAIDAVQEANSGHPGTPMALAPIAYLLSRQMRYDPRRPDWPDRDRFVLSAGHASMLLYGMLHLSGYDLELDELRRFRQWGSRTPGHPEHGHTPGVETTTGPLGQGLMTAVGMALAEAHLAARFNRPGHEIVDHHTYVVASDGDMMEGASHEAGSLAGHLGLGKLVVLYDDNRITIDGSTDLAFSDDTAGRFRAYGWHVLELGEAAEDLPALAEALAAARGERERPSLLVVRSHIGFGSPNRQDTAAAHGAPLGEEETRLTKRAYGWPEDARFLVPERARRHMGEAVERGARFRGAWEERLAAYRDAYPEEAAGLEAALAGHLPAGWDEDLPRFTADDGPLATRSASERAIQHFAPRIPTLVGGSADLTASNNTRIPDGGDVARGAWGNRNVNWGIREHVMCAASSGLALHGGVRPFAATFLVFTDYARPAIRLAALMGQPVIYVMTHDSIGLGQDGPTHQPVEHVASLRAIPGLRVFRPADANETVAAWRAALAHDGGPSLLALTRQKLPVVTPPAGGQDDGTARGAYVLAREDGTRPDAILIATGSEVHLALAAREVLAARGVDARVVSMPCQELFRAQDAAWREEVLPAAVTARVSIEAGVTRGWREWTGARGVSIGLDRFGASAPAGELFRQFGFTPQAVADAAATLVAEG